MGFARRGKVAGAALVGMALVALAAPQASAEDTATTFTLTDAGISVSVPANATLSAGTSIGSTTLSAQLGTVEVSDNRGGLLVGWTASVTSSAFTTAAEATNNSIANSNVTYTSGVPTVDGIAVVTGSGGTGLVPVTLGSSQTAMSATGVTGAASASWNPTVAVTVPNDVVAGTYTGTITHSVA